MLSSEFILFRYEFLLCGGKDGMNVIVLILGGLLGELVR